MSLVKSKQRVADHGEVFTPAWMVEAMLDLVKDESERIDSRFLEPACGSGNFIVQVLRRKLAAVELRYGKSDFEKRHSALLALMCIYGIELLADNIAECRAHVLKIFSEYLKLNSTDTLYGAASYVLSQNVVHGDALTMRSQDGQAITFAEWGYLGKGKYQRRDFRLDVLTGSSAFSKEDSLFAHIGMHEIFAPTKNYPPITVGELAATAFIHTDNIKTRITELFGEDMQFDVIVGNPPYQLNDGGSGTSAAPIYQLFVEQAKALEPRYLSMIIPARWFAGGKGLDKFRESMLADNRLRSIADYLSAADVFPGVGLKGGVCYLLWNRDHPGLCNVSTHFKDWPVSTATRPLMENGADIFVRFNEGLSILKKVMALESDVADGFVPSAPKKFYQLVSSLRPFGFRTYFRGRKKMRKGDVTIYQNGGTAYVARDEVETGTDLIDKWKIYVGRAAPGTGNRDTYPHRILSTPFIGEAGSICSETYLCIGPFNTKAEAESALSYLTCRLTRLLILLHKPSQDTTRKVYTFVPKQEWIKRWTDEDLYAKYGISASEIEFIEKLVRPMDLTSDLLGDVAIDESDDE